MTVVSNHDLLASAQSIAAAAAEEILKVYDSDFDVESKADESPLTAADLASHQVITTRLTALTPSIPILSEESAEIAFSTRQTWSEYWLVDPLDGTKEFVKRNGEFTVNIALIRDGAPVIGVVHVPVTGVCYAAAEGVGAFKDAEGRREPIRVRAMDEKSISAVGSRSHSNESTQAFLEKLGPNRIVSIGSSLKICLVAEGAADVYPRFGPTSEWDTAAAHCVVEQAGGRLTDLSLNRLRYNTKESLLNPFFIVFGDPNHDWGRYIEGGK